MLIDDGGGKNGPAKVSSDRRLEVSAETFSRAQAVCGCKAQAFSWTFPGTFAAGDNVAYLKNTSSTKNLVVDSMKVGAVQASLWLFLQVTGTAAAGETITGANLRVGSGVVAEATAMAGDTAITGLTITKVLGVLRVPASFQVVSPLSGVMVLPPGQAIAVEYDQGTTGVGEVEIVAHFEEIE